MRKIEAELKKCREELAQVERWEQDEFARLKASQLREDIRELSRMAALKRLERARKKAN